MIFGRVWCRQCADYCWGPWPNSWESDITLCACPAGSLNLDNNCCLSQNWIITLAAGFGGLALLALSSVIAFLCLTRPAAAPAAHPEGGDRHPLTRGEVPMNVDTMYSPPRYLYRTDFVKSTHLHDI